MPVDSRTSSALHAISTAAAGAGYDAAEIRPLRVGANVVALLPRVGVVGRAVADAGNAGRAQREIDIAAWLVTTRVPVVKPATATVTTTGAWVVSFWDFLPGARAADLPTLAASLRLLHDIAPPKTPELAAVEAFDRTDEQIGTALGLDQLQRSFLRRFRLDFGEQLREAEFVLPVSVIHGDGHMDNLLRGDDGQLGFVDLEHVGIGQPEWDLTLTALYYECGWFTGDQYTAFVEHYGYDVREAAAWPVLRGIRMLRMVTWLAQTAVYHPDRRHQLEHRLASLRDGTAPAGWTGF